MNDTRLERAHEARREAPGRHVATSAAAPRRRLGLFDGPEKSTILRRDATYRRMLAVGDAAATLVAAEVIVAVWGIPQPGPVLVLLPLLAVLLAKLLGLYDRDELLLRKSTLDEGGTIFQLATLLALFTSLGDRLFLHDDLSARAVFMLWGLTFTLTLLGRWAARHLAHRLVIPERCLVIGHTNAVSAIGDQFEVGGGVNAILVGEFKIDVERDPSAAMRDLADRVEADDIHRVILAPHADDHEVVLDLVRMIKRLGVKVSLLPRLFEVVGSSVVFDSIGGMTVLGIRRFGLSRSSAALKRAMDIAGAGLMLIAAAPVIAVVALAIKLDSPGPVFFRQQRVGRGDSRFEVLKFRSMVRGAEAMKDELITDSSAMFKHADDPRLTRVGPPLRRTSLDELPQLLNVLRGDMSLVGPRPLVFDEDKLVHGWQRSRLQLTPGMTGPWQILGSGSKRVPLHEMVNLDCLYIANWSVFNDVKIMLRTVLHMLKRSGV